MIINVWLDVFCRFYVNKHFALLKSKIKIKKKKNHWDFEGPQRVLDRKGRQILY